MASEVLRLIILRHAKSSWASATASDHERPLNKRGRRDAPIMGQHIVELGWRPDHVLSSDAMRTQETMDRMLPFLGGSKSSEPVQEVPVDYLNALYLAGLDEVQSAAADLGGNVQTLMVVGHNPGWQQMATDLTGEDSHMTTCNAALLSVRATGWSEALLLTSSWTLEHLLRPTDL